MGSKIHLTSVHIISTLISTVLLAGCSQKSNVLGAFGSGNNSSASTGSPSPSATPSGPATTGKVKWNPGHYMMNQGANNNSYTLSSPIKLPNGIVLTTGYGDIDALALNYKDTNGNPIVMGYAPQFAWNQFEDKVLGQYDFSAIGSVFNYLQYKIPGAHMAIGVAAYDNTPSYIINGSAALYGTPFPGAQGPGYGESQYDPTTGKAAFSNSALWNENVMARWMLLFKAMADSTVLPPYNGNQYTIDTHPLIEYVYDYGPTDLDTSDDPDMPSDYSVQNWYNQWIIRMTGHPQLLSDGSPNPLYPGFNDGMAAVFPHTNVGLMPGFGATGEQPTDQLKLVQQMLASRIALSSTDVQAAPSVQPFANAWAQEFFIGATEVENQNPPYNLIWTAGTNPNLGGVMASMPTVQAPDYVLNLVKGQAQNTVAVVQSICQNAITNLHSSHIFWSASADTNGSGITAWTPSSSWPGFIFPGLLKCPIPAANLAYPSSYPQ